MINRQNLITFLFKWSFLLFIFVLSFSSSFKFSNLLPLPLFFLFLSLLFYSFKSITKSKYELNVNFESKILIFFIIMQSIHLLIFTNFDPISLRHYTIFIFLLFVFIEITPSLINEISFKSFININFLAVLFVAVICILEFFLVFFDFRLTDYLFRFDQSMAYYHNATDEVFKPTKVLFRSVAFSTEPIQVGYYLLSLGPLAFLINNKYKKYFPYIFLILILGIISTLSSISLFILFLNIVVLFFYLIYFRFYRHFVYLLFTLLIIFFVTINSHYFFVYEDIVGKIFLDTDFKSVDQRLSYLKLYINYFIENPYFGMGAGYFSKAGYPSAINFYITFLATYGIIHFLILIYLFIYIYYISMKKQLNTTTKIILSHAFFNSTIFLFFLSTYWNLFHFVILSLLLYISRNNGKILN